MNESQRSTSVMDEARSGSPETRLSIHVCREGEPTMKSLRLTVQDFNITDKQHVYGIKHLLGLEPMVDSVSVFNGSGDVYVTFQHWQLLNEVVATQVAKSIGNALGVPFGHIDVTVGRLD